jgi:tetratricopeptide (TPR) repeat protein
VATIPWWPVAFFACGLMVAVVVQGFRFMTSPRTDQAAASSRLDQRAGQPEHSGPTDTESFPATESTSSPSLDDLNGRDRSSAQALFAKHLRQGYVHLTAGRHADALKELTAASTIDPSIPDTYHYMGEVYRQLQLLDKADRAYRKALAVKPDFGPSRRNLAWVLYEAGQYEEATGLLARLRKEHPEDTFILKELALNTIALGKSEEAIQLLEQYNRIEGQQVWGYTHLGRALADAGHHEQAEAALRQAIAINPNYALAQYWLGQLLAATGRKEQSKEPLARFHRLRQLENESHRLKRALWRNPQDLKALVSLARLRYHLGSPNESLALLKRARKLAPDDPNLIQLYQQVSATVEKTGSGR